MLPVKKSVFIFLSIFLSALVVYGGSGVNAYFFCCDTCRSEGASAIIEHKCCEIHHHHHLGGMITHIDEHQCDQHFTDHHDACGVDRIQFDWESQQTAKSTYQLQPLSVNLSSFIFLQAENVKDIADSLPLPPRLNLRTQKPPNLSKDLYFDLLTTLII